MFIASKNNVLIPGVPGQKAVRIPRGFMGEVPDWVGGTAYFQSLVRSGKIAMTENGKPKKPRKPPKEGTPAEGSSEASQGSEES